MNMVNRSEGERTRLSPELVALCERSEPRLGPETGLRYLTDQDYHAAASALAEEADGLPLWVFAYGSLLWRPAFDVSETRVARADGWRREFCLEIRRWRGSPTQPGLMMGLRQGGSCTGLVVRLDETDYQDQLVRLLKREIDTEEDLQSVRWVDTETSCGRVRALAFWAEPVMSRMFVTKAVEEQAQMLARACGSIGSGASYLYQTVTSLSHLGLGDEYLHTLENLVAQEILKYKAHFFQNTTPTESIAVRV